MLQCTDPRCSTDLKQICPLGSPQGLQSVPPHAFTFRSHSFSSRYITRIQQNHCNNIGSPDLQSHFLLLQLPHPPPLLPRTCTQHLRCLLHKRSRRWILAILLGLHSGCSSGGAGDCHVCHPASEPLKWLVRTNQSINDCLCLEPMCRVPRLPCFPHNFSASHEIIVTRPARGPLLLVHPLMHIVLPAECP